MYDCSDELHFDCGCDEEFASRPRQRYCGCGNPMGQYGSVCDDCLDITLSKDFDAAMVLGLILVASIAALATWREDRHHAHDEDCRCQECCCAYVG